MIGIQGETALDEVTKSPADAGLSTTSTNSVQNKVVTKEINGIKDSLNKHLSVTDITVTPESTNKLYGNWYFRKHGDTVQIQIDGFKNLVTKTANEIIHGIPESLRPARNVVFSLEFNNESYRIIVLSNGTLTCYPYDSIAQQANMMFTLTYIV